LAISLLLRTNKSTNHAFAASDERSSADDSAVA
jgi:hypothetical protein